MNELELVRAMRLDVAAPTPGQLARGRERLLASLGDPPPRARERARRLPAIGVAALTGAVAAAAIMVAGMNHGSAPQASTVAKVLRTAAFEATSRAATVPRPRQWIYTRTVDYSVGGGRTSAESWLRFDGREEAYYQGGRLVVHRSSTPTASGGSPLTSFVNDATPSTAYAALVSLPADPARLLADVTKHVSAPDLAGSSWDPVGGHSSRAQLEFGFLSELLWNSAELAPPRAEASAFHALAKIPGVHAHSGISDALGRSAIALSIGGVEQQLLLDPSTYQVVGARTLSDGHWPAPANKHGATIPKGQVVESLAWARSSLVGAPGRR